MTVTCQCELFSDALVDITPLIDDHWEEVGSFRDEFMRHIDFTAYLNLEKAGRLLTVTAREDGRLVGYVVGALTFDLHRVTTEYPYRRVGAFSALVNFMVPGKRGYARLLTRAVEEAVAAHYGHPATVSYRTKRVNAAGRFFEAVGYQEMETTYTKIVRPEPVAAPQEEPSHITA